MKNTIGEVVDVILPHANSLTVTMSHGKPFVTAVIAKEDHISQFILYVVQTSEYEYACVDVEYITCGCRFFVNNSVSKPLIIEKDFIQQKFGDGSPNDEWYTNVVSQLNLTMFVDHFISIMSHYNIIRYTHESADTVFTSMGIESTRIKRAIERGYKELGYHAGTIKDLIDALIIKKLTFSIHGLREREIACVVRKLKSIGISPVVDGDVIISITLIRN